MVGSSSQSENLEAKEKINYRLQRFIEKISKSDFEKRLIRGDKLTTIAKDLACSTKTITFFCQEEYGKNFKELKGNLEIKTNKINPYRFMRFLRLGHTLEKIAAELHISPKGVVDFCGEEYKATFGELKDKYFVKGVMSCQECGDKMPLAFFNKNSATNSGYSAICKYCKASRQGKPYRHKFEAPDKENQECGEYDGSWINGDDHIFM